MRENNDFKQETEREIDELEQKSKRSSERIFGNILGALQKGLKRFSDTAGEELKYTEKLASRRVEQEEAALDEIGRLREGAAEAEREMAEHSIAEKQAAISLEVEQYRNMMEQKARLEENTYANSSAMRDEYFALGQTEWERYADYIYEKCASSVQYLETEQKRALLSVFRDVRSEIEKSYEALLKSEGRLEDKLSDYGGLYTNVTDTKSKAPIRYDDISIEGMEKSKQALLNYEQYLTEAKELLYKVFPVSGVSESVKEKNREHIREFFAELADMSVSEGAMFASYLTTQPQEYAAAYLTSWAEKQDLAAAISKKLYSDEEAVIFEESAKSMSVAFGESLEKHFGSVPQGFYNKGVLSAKNFSDGFKAEMENALSEVSFSMENIFEKAANTQQIQQSSVVNNSSYNIYGTEPQTTALEIYKYDTMKRMLTE